MVTGQVEVSIQDLVMVRVNRGLQNKIFKDARGRTINSRAMYARNFSTSAYTKSLTTEENTKCSYYHLFFAFICILTVGLLSKRL